MEHKKIILAIMAVALVSLACTININLPTTQLKTGPTVVEKINIPFLPDSQAMADVSLKFGAGTLTIQGGSADALISGTATYNVTDFKPVITTDSNNINLEQGNLKLRGIPFINQDIKNDWNLSLANRPMSLVIEAGAYTGNYELGGLSIHKLEIKDGASQVVASFSKPNQVEMVSFDYATGASDVTLKGLGNANLTDLTFHSGAGNYTLDFSGQLSHDMTVTIESGVSSVTVIVPEGVAAQLSNEGNFITISSSGDWQQNGNLYQHPGSGYRITIQAKIGAGNLKLETGK